MPLQSNLVDRGLCLLSLDAGGGPRGISQLEILVELMSRLSFGDHVRTPCAVFDMIGGTGSGGFIAILLVVFKLPAEKAMEEFIKLSHDILEMQGLDAQARTTALEEFISNLLKKHGLNEYMRLMDSDGHSDGCKLVVPLSYKYQVGPICILRNFDVGQEQVPNPTIAEALLATLATPPLFSSTSIFKGAATVEYIDAGLGLSNPTREIIVGAHAAFGPERLVACLLSLGCGHRGVIASPECLDPVNWASILERLAADSEQLAQIMDSQMGHLGIYHRFSVTRGLESVPSVASLSPGEVLTHTNVYLADVLHKVDRCVGLLQERDGGASLEQLKHSGGGRILPPALPPLTKTFVMREEPWEKLKQAILGAVDSEDVNGQRMSVVTGIGGCGKTQLILKFMWVHKEQFSARIFIDGSTVSQIRADIKRNVRSLGTAHSQMTFEDCLLFLAQPTANGPRLLVYDAVDDPELELAPLLPRGESCAIIVTSRNRSIGDICPIKAHLELGVMSLDEAVKLLLQSNTTPEQDREKAYAIAEELGCLPIALQQARSYMFQTGCSAAEYLERLLNSRDKLLGQPIKHQSSTYAAFDASFQKLTLQGQKLLRLLSNVHCSNFPVNLIILAARHQFSDYQYQYVEHGDEFDRGKAVLVATFLRENKWSLTNLDEIMISLQEYSLISLIPGVGTKLLQMHSVLHEWVRSRIPEDDRTAYQSAAILMVALGSRKEHTTFAQYLARHVTHLSPLWDQLHINNAAAFGDILHNGGLFQEALGLRQTVVATLEQRDMRAALLDARALVASTYFELGEFREAKAIQEKIQVSRKEELGEGHLTTLMASSNLAITLFHLEDYKDAEVIQKEVLKLRKEILGDHHHDSIAASINLASTLSRSKQTKEAEVLQQEVLEQAKQVFGERDLTTLRLSSNLAGTYCRLEKFEEAKALQEEVSRMMKEVLGERHPFTLMASGNLANTYVGLGLFEEARILHEGVLRLMKEMLGERHINSVKGMINLAGTYEKLGLKSSALELLTTADPIISETLGNNHRLYTDCQEAKSRVQNLGDLSALVQPTMEPPQPTTEPSQHTTAPIITENIAASEPLARTPRRRRMRRLILRVRNWFL